jgi:hypothetical protein
MNRLRAAYLELEPDLALHFITGTSESAVDIFRTFGTDFSSPRNLDIGRLHALVTTPSTIAFVDATLAAVLAAIVVIQLKVAMLPAAGVGVVTFLITGLALALFGFRTQAMAHMVTEARSSGQKTP